MSDQDRGRLVRLSEDAFAALGASVVTWGQPVGSVKADPESESEALWAPELRNADMIPRRMLEMLWEALGHDAAHLQAALESRGMPDVWAAMLGEVADDDGPADVVLGALGFDAGEEEALELHRFEPALDDEEVCGECSLGPGYIGHYQT